MMSPRQKITILLTLASMLFPFAGLGMETRAKNDATPLSQEQLSGELQQVLLSHFSLAGELQIELLRPWSPPNRLASHWELVVLDYPPIAAASMLLRCRILADGEAVGDYTLTMKAMLWGDGWAARQRIANGTNFDATLLDLRRVDFLRDREALPSSAGDNSFMFARAVNPGRLLTWRDIGRRPLVRKGEVVEVSAKDGMLVITMKAIALQSGAEGEAVMVRNPESRRDFTAFVIDNSRVQVRF